MADKDIGLEGRIGLLEPFTKWTLSVGYFRGLLKQFVYFSVISDFDKIKFFQQMEIDVSPLVDYENELLRIYNSLGIGIQYKTSEAWDYLLENTRRRVEGRPSPTKSIAELFEKHNPVVPKPEDRLTDEEVLRDMFGWVAEQIGYEIPKMLPKRAKETEREDSREPQYELSLEILKAIGQLRVSFYRDLLGFKDRFLSATGSLRSHLGRTGHSMAQAILYDSLKTLQLYEKKIMPESFQTLLNQYPREAGKLVLNSAIQLRLPVPDSTTMG
ncbi:MAG: hypothetical protein Q8N99_04530 [Nanoarchaeota archaeon]|nr:hypothetical protein [Nanoarchaeota archaeon]